MTQITDTTCAYLQLPGGWFQSNAGWITGSEGTLLVDTCATESQTRHLLDMLPVNDSSGALTAAITHGHGDHANGAALVARAGGQLQATSHAAREILAGPHTYPSAVTGVRWGSIPPPGADALTVIDQPTTADLGGNTAEILPVPHTAHTAGDLVVWVPYDGVLFTGDLVFTGVTPLALHGSITGWLNALQWLSSFEARTLVPGHGPITTNVAATLTRLRDYLDWVLASSSADVADAYADAVTRWPDWHDPERHIVNLRVAQAETQQGTVNPDKALQEMLQWIGGKITPDLR